MTFIYDLSTNVGKLRLYIGDSKEDEGVRPDGRNFSNEEIQHFIDTQAQFTWAVGMAFETLAAEWSNAAVVDRQGDSSIDAKAVADKYSKRASEWYDKQTTSEQQQVIGLTVYSAYDDD